MHRDTSSYQLLIEDGGEAMLLSLFPLLMHIYDLGTKNEGMRLSDVAPFVELSPTLTREYLEEADKSQFIVLRSDPVDHDRDLILAGPKLAHLVTGDPYPTTVLPPLRKLGRVAE